MDIFGVYNLTTGECQIEGVRAKHLRQECWDVWALCATDGPVCEGILQRFTENKQVCLEEMFLAVVYDRDRSIVTIVADETTSPWNFYYVQNEDKVFFSTSLKDVLLRSKIQRVLDIHSAKAFLANGYIVGETTLIENVKKLSFGHEIVLKKGEVVQVEYAQPTREKISPKAAKTLLLPTIQKSIEKSMEQTGDVFVPVSNGYDSNLILHTVLGCTDRKVQAYTVGSKNGSNETAAVKENVKNLNVDLYIEQIDETYFEHFADIVWRLDGSVYESGVFLQYALAKAVGAAGAKYLLCGEGSDEVQNQRYAQSRDRVCCGKNLRDKKYFTYSDPFVGTNMMIMKKSAIMLNSFGVVGRYPFKSASVVSVAAANARANGTEKKLYKRQCQKLFPPSVAANVQTRGGTTGVKTVLDAGMLQKLKETMHDHELISKIRNAENTIVTDAYTKKLRREQGLKRIVAEISGNGLAKGTRNILRNRKDSYLGKLFKEAYLVLFDKLFISGEYDHAFGMQSVPVVTSDLIFVKDNEIG